MSPDKFEVIISNITLRLIFFYGHIGFWIVLVLCRDTRPVSSRPDFLVPSGDFPIGIESEGNGRDENLQICVLYD